MTGKGTEPAIGEPFEKQTAGVAMDGRGDLPGAGDVKLASFHLTDHVRRSEPQLRPSADATRIRWSGTSQWWRANPLRSRYVLAPSTIRRTASTGRWRTAGRDRPGR